MVEALELYAIVITYNLIRSLLGKHHVPCAPSPLSMKGYHWFLTPYIAPMFLLSQSITSGNLARR